MLKFVMSEGSNDEEVYLFLTEGDKILVDSYDPLEELSEYNQGALKQFLEEVQEKINQLQ